MSVIIRIPGADFSSSGLPKLQRQIYGIPADSLTALYLFEDGADGATVSTVTDSSGNGNHAELYAVSDPATKRSYGIEVAGNIGSTFDTGIVQTPEFTVIACAKHKVLELDYAGYPTFFTDTEGGYSNGHGNRLSLNIDLNTPNNTVGVYDYGAEIIGSARKLVPASEQLASDPFIVGLAVSGSAGEYKFKSITGYKNSATSKAVEIANEYNGLSSTMLVGCWPHGADAAVDSEIYAYAIYDKLLTDEEMSQAMTAIKSRVQLRGVVF
jgi:hypothetical protein